MPWDEWFEVQNFLDLVRKQINVTQTGDLRAFTHDDTVYCTPDGFYEAARELAKVKKVIDISLYRLTDQEIAVRKVIRSLNAADVLRPEMKPGYIGLSYEVRVGLSSRKMFLVPVKTDAFGLPSEVEKLGSPGIIGGVKAYVSKNTMMPT